MLRMIPLLLIVAVVYNVLVFASDVSPAMVLFTLTMASGTAWQADLGGLLIAVGLILLYLEILKATRTSAASIVDHVLSTALFIACLLEFILLPRFGTTVFFLITLMTLIDVIAGFTVTIVAARRDFAYDRS